MSFNLDPAKAVMDSLISHAKKAFPPKLKAFLIALEPQVKTALAGLNWNQMINDGLDFLITKYGGDASRQAAIKNEVHALAPLAEEAAKELIAEAEHLAQEAK
jgi:hypothetical protein